MLPDAVWAHASVAARSNARARPMHAGARRPWPGTSSLRRMDDDAAARALGAHGAGRADDLDVPVERARVERGAAGHAQAEIDAQVLQKGTLSRGAATHRVARRDVEAA